MKKAKLDFDRVQEEKDAIARTYKDYITTFQETSLLAPKTFVKSSTLYADKSSGSSRKGELYTPKILIPTVSKPSGSTKAPTCGNVFKNERGKRKKSSNLESLGNELKLIHMERMQGKKEVNKTPISAKPSTAQLMPTSAPNPSAAEDFSDYANSTNLFITCLKSDFTEKKLIQVFGVYGPLASVKILWPRPEDRNSRSFNCGFVAFMSRKDAERALNAVQDRNDMKVSWGKGVKLPTFPIFIPPELRKLYGPPPPTGLPFNAQIIGGDRKIFSDSLIHEAVVKVTIPLDRNLLMLIHRMVEFVVREGPDFEAFIMTKERNNPDFEFLRDFKSPAHIYYRWKLYSILIGEPKSSWSMAPFRMFLGGSIWVPPSPHNFSGGMPEKLIENWINQVKLSDLEKDKFISILRNLSTSRNTIAKAMTFCLENSKFLGDFLEILVDSFRNPSTESMKKLARLYLLSDLLYNCVTQGIKVKDFNDDFRNSKYCTTTFRHLHEARIFLRNSQEFENFHVKVLNVLRSWIGFHVFDISYLTKLENLFLTGSESPSMANSGEIDLDGILVNKPSTPQNQDLIDDDDDEFIIGNTYSLFDRNENNVNLDSQVVLDETSASDDSKDCFSFKRKCHKNKLRNQNKFDMFCPYDNNNVHDGFLLK